MGFDVFGQVGGSLGVPGADDEGEPGVLDRVRIARRQHPGIGQDHEVGDAVRLLEGFSTGMIVFFSAGFPSSRCVSRESPDGSASNHIGSAGSEVGGVGHPWWTRFRAQVTEVERVLPRAPPGRGHVQQHRELVIAVSRTDVIDVHHDARLLRHRLDRHRRPKTSGPGPPTARPSPTTSPPSR